MGINVSKLFGTNSIAGLKNNGGVQRVSAKPVQHQQLYARMDGLDKTYGQSPDITDHANAGKYFGDPVYGANLDLLG